MVSALVGVRQPCGNGYSAKEAEAENINEVIIKKDSVNFIATS